MTTPKAARWLAATAALLAALLPPAAARAEDTAAPAYTRGTFAFILENDTFSGSDRYYTNGFLFAWASPSGAPPAWVSGTTAALAPFFPAGGTPRWGLAFGQKKFTPDSTLLRDPDPKDRPYAGWLYTALTLSSNTDTTLAVAELQLGIVGPSALGRAVQNTTHDILNIDRAYGWSHQLKDEPGVNLVLARQWRFNRPIDDDLSVGIVPSVAGSLGNVQTYGSLGLMARIGTALDADFGPPRARPVAAGSLFFEPGETWGWYAFAGVEGRAVGRDISLDGNTWRDSRSVDRETFIGDASLGAALVMARSRLTATSTIRSKEFTTQREQAQFGSISLAFRF